MQKILRRRTFPQEFRVGGHAKFRASFSAVDPKNALQLLARLCRHRALFHHQLGGGRFSGDQPRHVVNRRQVSVAGFQWRRTHTDENDFACPDGFTSIAGEGEPLGLAIR